MPEGPEVRREADLIESVLSDVEVTETFIKFDHLKELAPLFKGCQLLFIQTVGKGMVLHFNQGLSVYTHHQLYGRWVVSNTDPELTRDLRLRFITSKGMASLYSSSEVDIFPTEETYQVPFIQKNDGLDILNSDLSECEVFSYIQNFPRKNKALSALLLDQKFILGMGNYLRSEVLFESRINPFIKLSELQPEGLHRLGRAINKIMRQSYFQGGVTNSLELARKLKKKGYFFEDYRFQVFNREDLPCYVCKTKIKRTELNNRRLYYCPVCQEVVP